MVDRVRTWWLVAWMWPLVKVFLNFITLTLPGVDYSTWYTQSSGALVLGAGLLIQSPAYVLLMDTSGGHGMLAVIMFLLLMLAT